MPKTSYRTESDRAKMRSIRIPDIIWEQVQAKAKEMKMNVTQFVIYCLQSKLQK